MTPSVEVNSYYGQRWLWIQENNIEFEVVESIVDPRTYDRRPIRIRFKHDKDYTWFKLKWS